MFLPDFRPRSFMGFFGCFNGYPNIEMFYLVEERDTF